MADPPYWSALWPRKRTVTVIAAIKIQKENDVLAMSAVLRNRLLNF